MAARNDLAMLIFNAIWAPGPSGQATARIIEALRANRGVVLEALGGQCGRADGHTSNWEFYGPLDKEQG